ncbi:MAG TPA: hypothetical protein VG871_02040, partial [Vicinamibacterales bacterium]|nr:hypothetical protein [Vicinamibacterales bacterium]
MRRTLAGLLAAAAAVAIVHAQPPAAPLGAMRWRLIGPNRAGRAWAVAGVPGDPTTYYLGTPSGALWKSTNAGTSWHAISDAIPVNGFGAIAVAASTPQTLYVGSGQNTLGNGIYRSNDGGEHWQHAGLDDTKFITALLVDPHNPDVVLAGAGSGGNFGSMVFYNNNPTRTRGVYRTADGGRTWTHV